MCSLFLCSYKTSKDETILWLCIHSVALAQTKTTYILPLLSAPPLTFPCDGSCPQICSALKSCWVKPSSMVSPEPTGRGRRSWSWWRASTGVVSTFALRFLLFRSACFKIVQQSCFTAKIVVKYLINFLWGLAEYSDMTQVTLILFESV